MTRKYLAFDIETAKDIPDDDFNWRPYRPLGISCAAALQCDAKEPFLWHGKNNDGTPAKKMSQAEAGNVVHELVKLVEDGYTLLTWNGLGFDLDILAEESGAGAECKELALNHVDMMFHVFCDRGFPVALDKAAEALKIPASRPECPACWPRDFGLRANIRTCSTMWPRTCGSHSKLPIKCDQQRKFQWITRKGTKSTMDLPRGWLTVRDAMRLPVPDTSWMNNPIPRQQFTRWLKT